MTGTAPTADPAVAEELKLLRQGVSRLTAIVTSRLALPVASLTVEEAAERMRCSTKKLYSLLALGVFTDVRGEPGQGSPHKVLADEIDVYRFEGGEEACKRFRSRVGRC
jgi:hypothetical protein